MSDHPLFHAPKASRGVLTSLPGGFGGIISLRAQEEGEGGGEHLLIEVVQIHDSSLNIRSSLDALLSLRRKRA